MTPSYIAEKQISINAPAEAVWEALTDPAKVKQYMFGTEMQTDWMVGSPIAWRGEWKGETYEDKGEVLAVEPNKLLRMTYWSPMGGTADKPENYRTVTYALIERDGTTVLTVEQDNNASLGRSGPHG